MTLSIRAQATPCQGGLKIVKEILAKLPNQGYAPLITEAKQKFIEVFEGSTLEAPIPSEEAPDEFLLEYAYRRRVQSRPREEPRFPLAGDLFFSPNKKGIFYLAVIVPDLEMYARTRNREALPEMQLEVGFIGDSIEFTCFDEFVKIITNTLMDHSVEPTWNLVHFSNQQFVGLQEDQENRFVLANSLTESELRFAEKLEDPITRNFALIVKRSGGILASDLTKKTGVETGQAQSIIKQLSDSGLIEQEYVIICKKTSNQVNRVKSKEKIDKMTELGVLCSCGNPIAQERVEELFSPTSSLQKMLDQSFWMTARLVKSLKELDITEDRILLNLQEGAEEIDAFVDLDGTLLMFELKDNEFSMGHAYPFSGRIGLYKPDVAVIVSTKGVAPDVKEYFKRVKPAAEIVYVGAINELEANLQRIVMKTRSRRIYEWISQFEPMARVELTLAEMLAIKLGIEEMLPKHRRYFL